MAQSDFSIEKLRSKVGRGSFAKGNRYNVLIIPPSGIISNLVPDVPERLQYLCDAVSLPTKGIATNPHDIYGPPREIAYRETFTESALSFYIDDSFFIKKYFDDWQASVIDPETGNPRYYDNYTGTISITRLPNDATSFGNAIGDYKVELLEAYPSAVGEVALGHAQGSEVLKLSVTFKYRRWNSI